jgi:hypothetical protein
LIDFVLFQAVFALIPIGWLLLIAVPAYLAFQPHKPAPVAYLSARSRYGPILLAVVFALASAPILAMSLHLYDPVGQIRGDSPQLAQGDPLRLWTAVGTVLITGLAAGIVGTPAVRRSAIAGGILTFVVALLVGIVVLPFPAAMTGTPVGAEVFCLDSCSLLIDSRSPSTLMDLIFYGWAPFYEPVAVGMLALGVAAWTYIVRTDFVPARKAAATL